MTQYNAFGTFFCPRMVHDLEPGVGLMPQQNGVPAPVPRTSVLTPICSRARPDPSSLANLILQPWS